MYSILATYISCLTFRLIENMEIKDNHVTVALDLSRAFKGVRNVIVSTELNRIISLGREVDLLETIRRQDNPGKDFFTISKKELELHATIIGIEPILLDAVVIKKFHNYNLIELKDNGKVEIKFKTSEKIYNYAKSQIKEFNQNEQKLLNLIADGMVKPVLQEDFDRAILDFPEYAQKSIVNYLNQTKILSPIQAKESIFYSSPKIYKNKNLFSKLLENSDDKKVSDILEFISNNPGIPIETIDSQKYDIKLLKGLIVTGSIDSLTLDVNGTPRRYVVSSNLSSERYDSDHLDQVKKTLANFRFGERYSKWKLADLQTFLESMIDRGYAGKATPIGTDYKNLEGAGIVKVDNVAGTKYRFWMLKKDVIEDTLRVLKGAVPLIENNPTINLHQMENSVLSRIILSQTESKDIQEVTTALRKIQMGLI